MIQKYVPLVRDTHPRGQSWATFLGNHGHAIWACDFVQTYDILFRPVFLFFMVHLRSRRIEQATSRARSGRSIRRVSVVACPRNQPELRILI